MGTSAYAVAVLDRTSLGVAGLDAATRFGIGPAALSSFSTMQLLIYAGMQVPVGLLVDGLGPRRVILCGLSLLGGAQLGFAVSEHFEQALACRALLGCGDAMIFVSVLRLISDLFDTRRIPLLNQLTGIVGTVGNLATTLVMPRMLDRVGWSVTFAGTAFLGFAVLAVAVAFLRAASIREPVTAPAARASGWDRLADSAPHLSAVRDIPTGERRLSLRHRIVTVWREPGTRLGMWIHFSTSFPASAFMLLWGMPFLTAGQGLSSATAGTYLSVVILTGIGFSLLFGHLVARNPSCRLPIVFIVLGATGATWAAVIALPGGSAPAWLLVTLTVVLGSNGPATLIGLEFARSANPPERTGTASSLVIIGGFVSSVVAVLGIGLALDLLTSGNHSTYTAGAFRVAFCVLYPIGALGAFRIARLKASVQSREDARASATGGGTRPVA